jgi:hypothetical protein
MDDEPRQCAFCERAWGLIGAAAGLAILAIGLDLILGGALTSAVFRRRNPWSEATDDSS